MKPISILMLIVSILAAQSLFAQRNCKPTKNKEAVQLFTQAQNIKTLNPVEYIQLLQHAVFLEPTYYEAAYELGLVYFNKLDLAEKQFIRQGIEDYYEQAETNFKLVQQQCESYLNYDAYFYLGEMYYLKRDFQNSKIYFDKYMAVERSDRLKDEYVTKRLKHIAEYFNLLNNPVVFNPEIVPGVCTAADEFLPLLSPDGILMFYTRRVKKNAQGLLPDDYQEELMLAHRTTSVDSVLELYTEGMPMPAPFNDGRLQGGASITLDNKEFFITICDLERSSFTSFRNCDIYHSIMESGKWKNLRKLPSSINFLNSFEGQPSISPDGRTLYYSSDCGGGVGGFDIYKVERNEEGTWGLPVNMGPDINTANDEKTPFIHPDNHTLYFSTNGRGGMGGFDIYVTRFGADSKWQTPENIGYPINTEGDEVGYIISANGKKLYFSSMMLSGKGGWDIYMADLPAESKPSKIIFLKGNVVDNSGQIVTDAKVELTNLETFESTESLVDNRTGKYAITSIATNNEDFMLTVKKRGYFYNMQQINSSDDKFDPPTTVNLSLNKIEPNTPVRLENVVFETNSAELSGKSVSFLNEMVKFLNENAILRIEIRGHTDNVGKDEDNMLLSEARARTVRNYLVISGIDKKRLSYKAFGETMPLTTNTTTEGRSVNRRVEFVVLP